MESTLDKDSLGRQMIMPVNSRFKWMMISVVAMVVVQVVYLFYLKHLSGLAKKVDTGNIDAAIQFQQALGIFLTLSFLILVMWILSIVAACLWRYRVGSNLHYAGIPNLRFTPGWYVGWFFIPVANFIMPFFCLSELYKGSAALNNQSQWDSWRNNKVSVFLFIWIIVWLGSIIHNLITQFTKEDVDTTGNPLLSFAKQLPDLVPSAIIGVIVYTVLAISLFMFARKITQDQNQFINN